MTMDKQAIEQIQNSAHIPALIDQLLKANTAIPAVIAPDNMTIRSLETFMANASRYRMAYTTNSLADFGNYCREHDQDGATCFVNAETMAAKAKISANQWADHIAANIKTLDEFAGGLRHLFADLAFIVNKQPDDFKTLVQFRVSQHQADEQAKLDAERERIRTEEIARIERENKAKTDAPTDVATQAPASGEPAIQHRVNASQATQASFTLMQDIAAWADQYEIDEEAYNQLLSMLQDHGVNFNSKAA